MREQCDDDAVPAELPPYEDPTDSPNCPSNDEKTTLKNNSSSKKATLKKFRGEKSTFKSNVSKFATRVLQY